MPIRNILAPMPYAGAGETALKAALGLAKIFNSHVDAFHVGMDPNAPIPYVAGPMPTELLVQISENAEEHARKLAASVRAVFDKACEDGGIKVTDKAEGGATSASWSEDVGSFDYRYGLEGRLHDISVVAQPDPDDRENTTDILEGLLFHSARPVLLVPATGLGNICGKVVVAWNGSSESTRALWGAMPILSKAGTVVILTVGDTEDLDGPDGRALADSLTAQGIKADIVETKSGGHSDGEAVLKAAEELEADLLVMGAYSHSRLRELIWGGVTQEVIEGTNIPVLMNH